MAELSTAIEGGKKPEDAARAMLVENYRVVFNGNGYSEEWRAEADKRGLWNLKTAPDAIAQVDSKKNVALFSRHKVFSERGLQARKSIMYGDYIETILLETTTMLEMLYSNVIPACLEDVQRTKGMTMSGAVKEYAQEKIEVVEKIADRARALKKAYDSFPEEAEQAEQALYCRDNLKQKMTEAREVVDVSEKLITHALWPFPKYDEILYIHHPESDFDVPELESQNGGTNGNGNAKSPPKDASTELYEKLRAHLRRA